MAKNSSSKVPAVLAFSRKLEVSDALMASGIWENIENQDKWAPIELHEKRNRATKSQYNVKAEEKSQPNLSWGDDAALPHDADTLRINYSLKVMGQLEQPTACDDPEFEKKILAAIADYKENEQFNELAIRYANNIANGRFLWRNRCGAENIKIFVKHKDTLLNFDVYEENYDLKSFKIPEPGSDLEKLSVAIKSGLSGDKFEYFEVTAYVKIGIGQHVWPSQEMVLNIPKGEKSRILFKLNGCAAIHSEKIGNAIRTIDNWYDENNPDSLPIAVEPYGSVTSRGEAYRETKIDFYTLLSKWLDNSKNISEQQRHFVMATLIRGGVFGGKDE